MMPLRHGSRVGMNTGVAPCAGRPDELPESGGRRERAAAVEVDPARHPAATPEPSERGRHARVTAIVDDLDPGVTSRRPATGSRRRWAGHRRCKLCRGSPRQRCIAELVASEDERHGTQAVRRVGVLEEVPYRPHARRSGERGNVATRLVRGGLASPPTESRRPPAPPSPDPRRRRVGQQAELGPAAPRRRRCGRGSRSARARCRAASPTRPPRSLRPPRRSCRGSRPPGRAASSSP